MNQSLFGFEFHDEDLRELLEEHVRKTLLGNADGVSDLYTARDDDGIWRVHVFLEATKGKKLVER